jgi:ABC-2 type transport system ATP-binding protein
MIAGLREEQRTILLTTHQIDEAARLCDRVAILDHGKLVAIGSPSELQERSSSYSLIIARAAEVLERANLPCWPGVEVEQVQNGGKLLRIRTRDTARTVVELVRWMDANAVTLTGIEIQRDSLEDAFLRLTADKEAE